MQRFYFQTLTSMAILPYTLHFPPDATLPSVARDLEERIQQLCTAIAATDDEGELNRLCVDLQKALSEHIQNLRQQVAQYRASSKTHPPTKGE
jgi:hypothetical protein